MACGYVWTLSVVDMKVWFLNQRTNEYLLCIISHHSKKGNMNQKVVVTQYEPWGKQDFQPPLPTNILTALLLNSDLKLGQPF